MTRYIDELETRSIAGAPSPDEVDAIIAEARDLRAQAMADTFRRLRAFVARLVTRQTAQPMSRTSNAAGM
ncbi:MAG: hypothetical protein AAF565_16405 [Pseudomonadota bacterium]